MASRQKRSGGRASSTTRDVAYHRAFAKYGIAEISLDWRRLRRRRWVGTPGPDGEPALWAGVMRLFDPEELESENRRFNEFAPPAAKNRMLFVAGSGSGIVYALDSDARVIAFDEIEAPEQDPGLGQVLADSLDELLAARTDRQSASKVRR